jgi:hypothetical protein
MTSKEPIVYIYLESDSPGLVQDATIYSMYIKNSKIITKPDEIIEKNYYLLFIEWIEEIDEKYFIESKKNIMMVNIDLFCALNPMTKYINLYICKTKYTEECLKELMNLKKINIAKLLFTKHTTLPDNLYNPEIKKNYKYFLHSAGKSHFKNTYLLIMTWLKYKLPPIIITCYWRCFKHLMNRLKEKNIVINLKELKKKHNIIFYNYKLKNEKLIFYKNYCGVHICTSEKEGYGHYLNEGRIVKAVIITIDGKPMNEFVKNNINGYLIPWETEYVNEKNMSLVYTFNITSLYETITKILNTDIKKLKELGEMGHIFYLSDSEFFIKNINKIRDEN